MRPAKSRKVPRASSPKPRPRLDRGATWPRLVVAHDAFFAVAQHANAAGRQNLTEVADACCVTLDLAVRHLGRRPCPLRSSNLYRLAPGSIHAVLSMHLADVRAAVARLVPVRAAGFESGAEVLITAAWED